LNIVENYIEKIFKEYLDYKNYLLSKAEEVKNQALGFESSEDQNKYLDYFEKLGWYNIAQSDLAQQKARLFFTMEAYKDLVEPPKELKQQIEKELEGITFQQVFAIKAGERQLVDQERYDLIKDNYFNFLKTNDGGL
jgi:hypothetical protein